MEPQYKQWLDEIEALQQRLEEARRECDAADARASHWRELYNTEAQQRRQEAEVARKAIADLEAKLRELQAKSEGAGASDAPDGELSNEASLQQECDRLREALQNEREAHQRTRTDLTNALGDTVSLLSKRKPTGRNLDELLSGEGLPNPLSTSEPAGETTAGGDLDLSFLDNLVPPAASNGNGNGKSPERS